MFGSTSSPFGQSANNQQSTGFQGFGTNNNASTGFGQPANTGFGTNSSGGSLFGASNNTTTNTGFGGFGAPASNPSPFGATQNRSGFGTGTTSGGGLFGSSNTATAGPSSGFGTFGSNSTNNTGSIFGSGASKPAFGASNNMGSGLFGSNSSSNAFGNTNNASTSGFGGAGLGSALGTNTTDCQGTGGPPFQPFQEKEGTSSNTNHNQSITFMPPYKNFSFEELRLADYNQGRRFGTGSGQAGAFGFPALGNQTNNTTSNPFGSQANNSSLFGTFGSNTAQQQDQSKSGAFSFGNNAQTAGGFGANSTGFGTNNNSNTTGGIFGTGNQTSNAFGNNSSGGIFGAKPASGGIFGTSNTASTQPTGSVFGSTTNNAGPFGSNQNNNPFGNQQQQSSTNAFGTGFGTNQNQSGTSAFGGFGQNAQSKPGGLFGTPNTNTNAGTGAFGTNTQNNQQQPASNSIFGTNNNQQQPASNSIFGTNNNQQQQPAANGLFGKTQSTGTGLFGTNNNSTSNTGSVVNPFGGFNTNTNANQGQQNQGGLFGNNNQQQQKPAPMFNIGNTSSSSNLFGTNNNNQQQPAGNSLFGTTNNNQQQQQGGLFGNNGTNLSTSLGASQQQQNPLLPPQTLQASLLDSHPWGSASIFSGLPPPPTQNVGPLATPISAAKSKRVNVIHPHYRINPSQSTSRLVTPARRGYGFTYSTYGTPSSVSSNLSTPGGFNSSLFHGSLSRNLGKSLSTSNLRRTFSSDGDSLLSPGAFSAGSSRYSGASSMRKLTIDRSLRTDLFSDGGVAALPSPDKSDPAKLPGILKKKVSFDTDTVGGSNNHVGAQTNGASSSEPISSATPSAEQQGYLRSSRNGNNRQSGTKANGVASPPEMEQVKGNELAIVHEDGSPESADSRPPPRVDQNDPQPGSYYMRPSRSELEKMTKEQKNAVANFEIGREGCGHVVFNQPVDLNRVPLDEIFDKIAVITLRSLTIYPDSTKKPLRGMGLNVPATISLENSWPRNKDKRTPSHEFSGPRFNKHVERLRKVDGTEFVRYEKETGVWVFSVPHFTTYGFDYDDEASEGESLHTGMMSDGMDTPTPKTRRVQNEPSSELSSLRSSANSTGIASYASSSPEDTFEFRKKKLLPGAFDDTPAFSRDHEMDDAPNNEQSFLGNRLADSPSDSGEDEPSDFTDPNNDLEDQSVVVHNEDINMAGSFPQADTDQPKSILKVSEQSFDGAGTPRVLDLSANDAWADQLQKTISPRKQDRDVLRRSQAYIPEDADTDQANKAKTKLLAHSGGKDITTSIDLMNSLFGKEESRRSQREAKQSSMGKGLKWPYPKQSISSDNCIMDESEPSHDSYEPSSGPGSILIYSKPSQLSQPVHKSTQTGTVALMETGNLSSDGREIGLAKLAAPQDLIPESLRKQRVRTIVELDEEVPLAKASQVPFQEYASSVRDDFHREKAVWDLAALLFDELSEEDYADLPPDDTAAFDFRIRKDKLSIFWEQACQSQSRDAVSAAPNAEERALAHLSAHKVVEACDALASGKDFRLAILVSQIGGDETMREDIATQIHEWRELNVLSEMTEPIRALYELLAGKTCICEGKRGPLEDRAKTFIISERFNLDWKRTFGLKLWYAIQATDPIEAAVKQYLRDLESEEFKEPLPWFIEENAPRDWQDPAPDTRQDLLWGCLLLYASSKGTTDAPPLADIVSPHNATGNPLNARLSFQLYQSLALHFPQTDDLQADQLTWDFATQLESSGEWLWAIFAVLHLTNANQRKLAIESLLSHHAASINDTELETLTNEFKIPSTWIWASKALLARSTSDHYNEVHYLIRADKWNEAHDVLCATVAPQCIIEQDYTTLQSILGAFDDRVKVRHWEDAAQMYEEFVWLMLDLYEGKERRACVRELVEKLPGMGERRENRGFLARVAVSEMGRVVAGVVGVGGEDPNTAQNLQLPAESRYLKESMRLSEKFANAVKA